MVLIRDKSNKKTRIIITHCALTNGHKLPPYILLRKMVKENLPANLVFWCQGNSWITNDLMRDWMEVVWNQRLGSLTKLRMLVSDAFNSLKLSGNYMYHLLYQSVTLHFIFMGLG
jgi:hypothetical protein